uniref:RING-type E3 ubiquitin transferase n=1 Tax=Myripristis murdjan TaxID=586833 RepID=A0A667YPX9_9TELE
MDGRAEKQESGDAVIIVENEAESMPVQEDKSRAAGSSFLDTCPVCHLQFHSREPKLLPCLHSFCKKCLPSPSRNLAMAEPPNFQVDGATKPLNVIRCPVCRQECMEVDVMENFFVKDSVEAPSSTVERTVQLCMTCDDNTEAAGFCVDCVEYLCATCVEAHQRVKFTKDHIIRQKEDVFQEAHGVTAQRPVFCDIHKQEPLKLFCETCDLLTCRDCQLLKHKDHNYQFLEDAYNNHKQHMESMTCQLQEKKKVIEEVSSSINNGLLQVDQNRTSVHNEIKKSICSLILEINKKGKILVNQLEAVTKDHENVLRKQQEDIGYLSRQLDHVINFTKWATARNGGTALLYCKRLILFQIGNLLRAKCNTSFVPQSSVRFQCRSSYWASNVDLGSLLVESVPGHQLGGVQGIPPQFSHPGQSPSGSPNSLALGGRLAPHNTLAQLQMQVDKLNPQPHWQPQPPPPPWTWYQSVRLQRTAPGPLQGGSPSQSMPPAPPQPGRRFMVPPPNHVSPTSSLPSPGFTPQVSRCVCVPFVPLVSPVNFSLLQLAVSSFPRTVSWKPPERHQANGAVGSAVKRRRRSSPGPIIVIKDEPEDDISYGQANLRPPRTPLEDPNEDWCAVCQNGGELLCCDKCPKVFHLTCHVPSLFKSPSEEWFCSFCRDLSTPEMEYDCDSKPEAKTVKEEPDSEGGFPPLDKRKCERLLLHLFCSRLSSDFQEPVSPLVIIKLHDHTPMGLFIVKKRLEAKQTLCYHNPAEFISDIRLIFRNCAAVCEADTKVAMAGRKLEELFEEHLKIIYSDQTFPEIKMEVISHATPPVYQSSSPDNISQPAKRQRRCSDSQDAPNSPKGEEEAVLCVFPVWPSLSICKYSSDQKDDNPKICLALMFVKT